MSDILKILEEARVETVEDFVVDQILDANKSEKRLIVNFLVDISGSMAGQLPVVNEQFNLFVKNILKGNNDIKYMLDMCVTTFGRNTVEVIKPFGLIKDENAKFNFKEFNGMTPLGSALLLACKHCLVRKQQYQETALESVEILYRPIIVVISDFADYDNLTAYINGTKYKTADNDDEDKNEYVPVYDKMTELIKELQEKKEITVVSLVAHEKYDQNKLKKLIDDRKYSYQPGKESFNEVLSKLLAGIYESMFKIASGYNIDRSVPNDDPITRNIEDVLAELGLK